MRKYKNVVITDKDGNRYDSKKEYNRYIELLILQKGGFIKDLQRQVPFELIPKQTDEKGKTIERAVKYYADFVYIDTFTGEKVVEDVKGYIITDAYKIKRKLMLQLYNIRIKEV